jgi:UDP-2,3-diacylglucosamine pyrophosphatase LpxH
VVVDIRGDKALFMMPDIGIMTQIKFKNLPQLDEEIQNTTDKLMQKYAGSDLIHGHTHRQNIHKNAQYTRYVLGDWHVDKGNAIEIIEAIDH